MHLHITSGGCELSLTMNCASGTKDLTIHPDNLGYLDASNANNPFDEVGQLHNSAILYAYERAGNVQSEKVPELISEYLSSVKFESKRLRALAEEKPARKTPYDTIFWPPIPDWLLEKEFQGLIRASEDFDASQQSYVSLKRQAVDFEARYLEQFEKSEDALAILGCCSIIRWSMAMWISHHIETAQSMVNAGTGNPQEVIYACNKVARADRRAYRKAMKANNDPGYAVEHAAHASHDAERSIPQRISVG